MKRDLVPTIRLHLEGDNNRICNALRTALLQGWYDEWLDTRQLVFDDDPDGPTQGYLTIPSLPALWSILRAFCFTATPVINLKDCYLWMEGGDHLLGYSVSLHNIEAKGEWRGDERILTNEYGKAFHEIKAIITDLAGESL